jgi:hypothetical protein
MKKRSNVARGVELICLADVELPPGVKVETTRVQWGEPYMPDASAREILRSLKRKRRGKIVKELS